MDLPGRKSRRRRPEIVSGEEIPVKLSPVQEVFLSTFILCPGQSLPTAQRAWFIQPKHVCSLTHSLLHETLASAGGHSEPHTAHSTRAAANNSQLCVCECVLVWVCVQDKDSDTVRISFFFFFNAPPCWIHTNKDFEELSLTVVSLKIECTCNSERTYFTAIPAGKNYFTLLLPPSPPLAHFLTLCRLLSGLKCPNKPTIHHCANSPASGRNWFIHEERYCCNIVCMIKTFVFDNNETYNMVKEWRKRCCS